MTNLPTLNDLHASESITALIYGSSGSGKTWFVGTAGSRTAIINIGAGLTTLKSPLFRKKYPSYNPIVITIVESSSDSYVEHPKLFDDVSDAMYDLLVNHKDKFDTIAIDDMTALRRGAMNKAIELNVALGVTKMQGMMKKFDTPLVGIAEYGKEMNYIEQFISFHVDLCKASGKHLIMTAHERLTYRKPDKIGDLPILQKIRPGFTGSTFPDTVPAYFDIVGHMESKGEGDKFRTVLRLQRNAVVEAKNRWAGIVPNEWENPDFLELIKKINEFAPHGEVKAMT